MIFRPPAPGSGTEGRNFLYRSVPDASCRSFLLSVPSPVVLSVFGFFYLLFKKSGKFSEKSKKALAIPKKMCYTIRSVPMEA